MLLFNYYDQYISFTKETILLPRANSDSLKQCLTGCKVAEVNKTMSNIM